MHLGALYVQLTTECHRHCSNCYLVSVKENPSLVAEALSKFLELNTVEQLVLSLNELPPDHIQWELANSILHKTRPHPYQLHIAVQNRRSLERLDYGSLYLTDIISLSQPTHNKPMNCHLNWNLRISKTAFADRYANYIELYSNSFDTIHLIVNKYPSAARDYSVLLKQLHQDADIITQLHKLCSPNTISKFRVDNCLEVVTKYPSTGFGCPSNISRLQLWPDGSITGCPYMYNSNPGDTIDKILQNLEKAKEEYDFNRCCITKLFRRKEASANTQG